MDLLGKSKTVAETLLDRNIAANQAGYAAMKNSLRCGIAFVRGKIW